MFYSSFDRHPKNPTVIKIIQHKGGVHRGGLSKNNAWLSQNYTMK